MLDELILQLFVASARQLWFDYVSDPQIHLWALAVMQSYKVGR